MIAHDYQTKTLVKGVKLALHRIVLCKRDSSQETVNITRHAIFHLPSAICHEGVVKYEQVREGAKRRPWERSVDTIQAFLVPSSCLPEYETVVDTYTQFLNVKNEDWTDETQPQHGDGEMGNDGAYRFTIRINKLSKARRGAVNIQIHHLHTFTFTFTIIIIIRFWQSTDATPFHLFIGSNLFIPPHFALLTIKNR